MRQQYGFIASPTSDSKRVDRTIGIVAAARYLFERQKLTVNELHDAFDEIEVQRNNNCCETIVPRYNNLTII